MSWFKRWVLPGLFEIMLDVLAVMAMNTSTDVDDKLVQTVKQNKDGIIKEMLKRI